MTETHIAHRHVTDSMFGMKRLGAMATCYIRLYVDLVWNGVVTKLILPRVSLDNLHVFAVPVYSVDDYRLFKTNVGWRPDNIKVSHPVVFR